MACVCGQVAAAHWKSAPKQWSASPSLMLSHESLQVISASASFAASSSSSFAEILTFSGRRRLRNHHGSFLSQRRRRSRVQIAAEGGEGEEPKDAESERWSLKELDEQLKVFARREASLPRQIPVTRQIPGDPNIRRDELNEDGDKLQWPTFTPGFFVFAAIGLFLLTIVNNLLYNQFLGPPVAERREAYKFIPPVQPRYRVTTRQEEQEARNAEEAQEEALAQQSRQAPLSSN